MQKVLTPVNVEGRAKLGIRPGDTVRVTQNIIELKKGRGTDKKEKTIKNARKQVFEGLVLAVKHGTEAGASFTVRATLSGVGVEKVFPLYSPVIDSIEIVKRSNVRRAKLYFIREKAAKAMRRQLRNARMLHLKSDEAIAVEEVAPEIAPEADTTAPETEAPTEEEKEAEVAA
ncbi:50S ribosomal protein L19 [Candidatus Kaiserbacteria bacterium RIFCSPLOWO2_12_FULL_52_8]|uniref:50S ribosomal protein L19 n=1 Tax=Candidatus Kaiserbacteria bacterium RIFCSPHIGHO2_01_FULL_53_31 TaxID=1798481 RepID=A0A1F6CIF4_9BACT|nr:MAG: 50S ribosomal protein L19 [Candidatus Kaiserbacteria bacterium RIFCSPHIGHO2_01_FULL_53_31]OGG93899.1 MAG: 50S ribosomal protein L19 [Candidatus Kaiserbacteria bacterium RIFCSPLOWO2_12_FULL_52_8]